MLWYGMIISPLLTAHHVAPSDRQYFSRSHVLDYVVPWFSVTTISLTALLMLRYTLINTVTRIDDLCCM